MENAYNALFMCTGNSARIQMAEVLSSALGKGRFRAASAGSHPTGEVHPLALRTVRDHGLSADGLRSKSWSEFADATAPTMDFVITVCDKTAGESCPLRPGHPATAHWSVPDPAASGDPHAFRDAWLTLRRRIELMLALPLHTLDKMAREQRLNAMTDEGSAS